MNEIKIAEARRLEYAVQRALGEINPFKVGDRVRVTEQYEQHRFVGAVLSVQKVVGDRVEVKWPDGLVTHENVRFVELES